MGKMTLSELVEHVDEIPMFSESVKRILDIVEDKNADAKAIEREIMKDQSFTVKVLRLANSAFFGARRKINTVSEAIVLLGLQAIKSMVFASTVGTVMVKELPGYALDKEELWKQSQTCAITARIVAKKAKYSKPDVAYTAGLLHDIGKVILDVYLSSEYKLVQEKVDSGEYPFEAVEEEVLGFNHGQVGARIAKKWRLPEELVESIALHHNPTEGELDPKLVAITHVADGLVMMMGMYLGTDGMAYEFSEEAMSLLGLDEHVLTEVMSEVADLISHEDAYVEPE